MIFERDHYSKYRIQKVNLPDSLNNSRAFRMSAVYFSKPNVFISHEHGDLDELMGMIEVFMDLESKKILILWTIKCCIKQAV